MSDVKRQTQRDLKVPVHSTLLICAQFPFPTAGLLTKGSPTKGRLTPEASLRIQREQPQRDNNFSDFDTRLPTQPAVVLVSRYPCKLQLVHPDQSWLITFELSVPRCIFTLAVSPHNCVPSYSLILNGGIVLVSGIQQSDSVIYIYIFSDYFSI